MRGRTRRRVAALGVLCVVGLAVTPAAADSADSDAPVATFALTAAADGVSLVVHNDSIPELPTIQVNTPTAQANTNSRGQSTAYSTAPDPGQGTAELPAALGGTLCATAAADGLTIPDCDALTADIPTYPFAYAQAGDDPQDQNFAAAHLHAEATSTSAFAQTTVGAPGAASATSSARTTGSATDGTATTTAETSVDGLSLTSALTITGIDSNASITIDSTGKATQSSSFTLGSLQVLGMDVGFDNGGFTLLGTPVPVSLPISTVFSALSTLGITAEFIPAISSPTSVTSEGLSLSYTVPGAPSGIIPPLPALSALPIGIGVPTTPTTVTYVLGRAEVTAKYKQLPALPSTDTFVSPSDSPTTTPATTTPTTTATAPAVDPGSGAGIVDTPPVASDDTGTGSLPVPDVAATTDRGSTTSTTPVTRTALARRAPLTSHSIDIYLALVIAALGSFAAATAVRHLGVRLSWTS